MKPDFTSSGHRAPNKLFNTSLLNMKGNKSYQACKESLSIKVKNIIKKKKTRRKQKTIEENAPKKSREEKKNPERKKRENNITMKQK